LKILPEMPDADYYAHLLNIQLDVYELTGNPPIIPILPYYSTLKLKLLHIIGIKRLCKLSKTLHLLMRRKR
ncbi:MAG: glycosyltransferase family 2 protein, partial [Prevotella sp.]|nr:glycosyltransferase family 2 protein [Prevotella sp.]